MTTQDQSLAGLTAILDRLEPGLILRIEDRLISAIFGNHGPEGITAGERLAKKNGCAFYYDKGRTYGDGFGVFTRSP
jgi:hypothetical protein